MAGTREGGKKAAATNKLRYGQDFYKNNGKIGGQHGHTGGFAANPELARTAGARGGRNSTRGKAISKDVLNNIRKRYEEYPETTFIDLSKLYGVSVATVKRAIFRMEVE